MEAVIYVRVSSGEQIAGTSLASQEAQCRKYCAEHELAVRELFREEGESAKSADRTELLRALALCKKNRGTIVAFVVTKVDRFARNTEDHFHVRRLLTECGVALHSVTEPIGNSPTEKFIETVLAAGAEFDNAIRKHRCTDGMLNRLAGGIWPWRAPVGYLCAQHRKRNEKKADPDLPDPILFPAIQRVLKEYSAGTLRRLVEVKDRLNELGFRTPKGMSANLRHADSILSSYLPFYAGLLVNPWTHEHHAGRHEPMIPIEIYHRIRLIRAGKLKPWNKRKVKDNPDFPLRGLLKCSACGGYLTGAFSTNNQRQRYPYYYCYKAGCSRRSQMAAASPIHVAFHALLGSIKPDARFWPLLQRSLAAAIVERSDIATTDAVQKGEQIGELKAKRNRIIEMGEDGSFTRELFLERLKLVDAAIDELVGSEATPTSAVPDTETLIQSASQFCQATLDRLLIAPLPIRKACERVAFPEGLVYDRDLGIRTPVLGPIFALFRAYCEQKQHLVDFG